MLVAMPIKEEKHSDKPKNNRQYKQGSSDSYVVIARWTKVVGIFTVILAIATIASAYFLWTTDETLRKTLEVHQRPRISVDTTIVGPFTIDEKGGYVRLKIEIKNVGLSMADDVRIFPVIYPDKIDNI